MSIKKILPRIGIVGGMGPMSGVLLQRLIIEATPATCDQDHLPVICFTNPQIPDRTASLREDDGQAFVSATRASVRTLLRAGATVIAIACNTAHVKIDSIQRGFRVPFVNMIDLAIEELDRFYPRARHIGFLGTDGAFQSGVYERALRRIDRHIVVPDVVLQRTVMQLIYRIKEHGSDNNTSDALRQIIFQLEALGADGVILGCTELSLAHQSQVSSHLIIDPLRLLAKKLVTEILRD